MNRVAEPDRLTPYLVLKMLAAGKVQTIIFNMATSTMESSVHVEENRDHDKPVDREKAFLLHNFVADID